MKGMLVINQMPNNCYDCKYCRFDARRYNFRGCILTDTDVQDGTIDICKEVHSCCPLKPLPEKIDIFEQNDRDSDAYPDGEFLADKLVESQGYERHGCCDDVYFGWNACIDKILEEKKWVKN